MSLDLREKAVTYKPPDPAPVMELLTQILIKRNALDSQGLMRARQASSGAGERLDLTLVRLGLVSDEIVAETLSELLGIGIANFPPSAFDANLIQLFPASFFRNNRILPCRLNADCADVVLCDPFDGNTIAAAVYQLEMPLRIHLAPLAAFDHLIENVLAPLAVTADGPGSIADIVEDDIERLKDLASEAPTIRLVNQIIIRGIEENASDIHFEPEQAGLRVRFRHDGMLSTVERLAPEMKAAVTSRLKVMAKLNIAERRLPQDGRIRVTARGREIDLRVSTIPSLLGESVVLRILDREAAQLDLTALGFGGTVLKRFRAGLDRPNGMMLVTGPTGSGKTTTLYAALQLLNDPARKIFTVEDPVEYQLRGIVQTQVQPKIGLDFATALRSILRQDPDIILVGEIRDAETLKIAIQSALTGHLVLSTLHTNSAAASITRLLDMGAENYLVASTLIGILAQRLVRKSCSACKGSGCPACKGSGFAGRTTIMEYLELSPAIRRLIVKEASEDEIEAAAQSEGMTHMLDDGMRKVAGGVTSEAEVLRAVKLG